MKRKYIYITILLTVVGFVGYQYISLTQILDSRSIFGVQDVVTDSDDKKAKMSKSEYLRYSLKENQKGTLKERTTIKKANPFYTFQDKVNSSLKEKIKKPKRKPTKTVKQPKPKEKKEEEQYFFSVKGETKLDQKFYLAVSKVAQEVKEGKLVSFYLKEDIPALNIRASSKLLGMACVDGSRIQIRITSVVNGQSGKPVPVDGDLCCYDQDFNEGIFFDDKTLESNSDIKEEVIDDILGELNSKALNLTRKYINSRGDRKSSYSIIIPKGKEVYLAIKNEEGYY